VTTLIRQTWDWVCFAAYGGCLLFVWWWMLITRRLDPQISWWKVCGGLFIWMGRSFTRLFSALARFLRLRRRLPAPQHLS